jgi:hypothetical protein
MKATWMLTLGGLSLVAAAGLLLAEDKPGQKSPPTSQKPSTIASEKPAVAPSEFPVIGYLEKRDQTIIIKSSSKGPVYSIKSADGKMLYENISAEQLRAKAPELHEFIKGAMAGSGSKKDARIRPKLDASLGLR